MMSSTMGDIQNAEKQLFKICQNQSPDQLIRFAKVYGVILSEEEAFRLLKDKDLCDQENDIHELLNEILGF